MDEKTKARQKNLEPIPKLTVDMYEFTPDNNSASKVNKSPIIGSFLFITDQQFTKTVEKRVSDFNDPTAGPEFRIALQLLLFLAAGTNMGRITMLLYLFSPV